MDKLPTSIWRKTLTYMRILKNVKFDELPSFDLRQIWHTNLKLPVEYVIFFKKIVRVRYRE